MRFTRIQVARFGPLREIDSGGTEPLPGLVAVHGPNEAGKSAFHHLLYSLLYGFYPATRDQNAFTPWSGEDIDIRGEVVVDAGAYFQVQRRLMSSPRGELVREGEVETLDNRNLPWTAHVDRTIYTQVYAIGAAELAQVHERAWEAVRDHLVVGMGSRDLRSPRAVSQALRAQGDRLWRPDGRGKPRHRELRSTLAELRKRRGEAEEADRQLREVLSRLGAVDQALELAGERIVDTTARLDHLRRLDPLRRRLLRLDELSAAVGDPGELAGLPRDPEARLRELKDRVLVHGDEVRGWEELEARFREAAVRLVGNGTWPGAETIATRFVGVPLPLLRQRTSELEDARRWREASEEQLRLLRARELPSLPPKPTLPFAVGVVGIALLAVGLPRSNLLWAAGLLLVLTSLPLLAIHWTRRGRAVGLLEARAAEQQEAGRLLAEHEALVAERSSALRELLDPLELAEEAVRRPPAELLAEIEGMSALVEERAGRLRSRADRRSDGVPDGAAGATAALETANRELEAFAAALGRAGGGVDPDGLGRVEARLRNLEHLERCRAELEEESDLATLREAIREAEAAGGAWEDIPTRRAREEARMAELNREVQELRDERGRLEERATHLSRRESVDVVDGRILEVTEELRGIERERDRLLVLSRVLDLAEHRFRRAHQPELLRRAESCLGRITGGRYARILVERGEDAGDFRLEAEHLPSPTPVGPPLSAGTREQVYFALRLAIVDHLDEGRECLPLLLDEVLMNWDPERRARTLDLLAEMARTRQIFLFTCHPHVAKEISERGGRVLALSDPARP